MKPRESFDLELNRLKDAGTILGSQVEDAIVEAVDCLKERDTVAGPVRVQPLRESS